MYYYSTRSHRKTVHTESCHIPKHLTSEVCGTFGSLYEAFQADYRLCRHCNPIVKQLRTEEAALLDYCFANGMAYYFNNRDLSITSTKSKWVITVSPAGKTILFHKNTKELKSDALSPIPGYHNQKVSFGSLMEYFEYINNHDRYRIQNPERLLVKKEPPRKGTKRWNKEQRKIKNRERRKSARNVLNIINSFDSSYTVHTT